MNIVKECIDTPRFLSATEQHDGEQFIKEGYLISPVENLEYLEQIRNFIVKTACDFLGIADDRSLGKNFLDQIHQIVPILELNKLRLHIIHALFQQPWLRPCYYHLAKSLLQRIVGSELVMQRNLGLSIQLPKDNSSLLNVHADSWSGDSPYEAVIWLPLVDCYGTKSMYILSPKRADEVSQHFYNYATLTNQEFFKEIEKDLTFIEINYGDVLIFNQNLPHGNVVNEEPCTRWTMNCRFKSIFSPYAEKKLGEFFLPITTAPMTKIAMNFRYPQEKPS